MLKETTNSELKKRVMVKLANLKLAKGLASPSLASRATTHARKTADILGKGLGAPLTAASDAVKEVSKLERMGREWGGGRAQAFTKHMQELADNPTPPKMSLLSSPSTSSLDNARLVTPPAAQGPHILPATSLPEEVSRGWGSLERHIRYPLSRESMSRVASNPWTESLMRDLSDPSMPGVPLPLNLTSQALSSLLARFRG
jgi:hypothetical protein